MAACSDRAAASTSASEETDMTTTASIVQPDRFGNNAPAGLIFIFKFIGRGRKRAGFPADRRQLSELSDPADDAIAEPESARSARHQPVHPAARRIRRRPAAAQHQRLAGDAGIPAADRAIDPGARLRRQDRGGHWQHRCADRTGTGDVWELSVPTASTVNVTIANSTGQTVFTGNYSVTAGNNQPFVWNGQGSDGTQ